MKSLYLSFLTLICLGAYAQQLDFNYPLGQHRVEYVQAENYESYEIQIHTDQPEPITYQYQLVQNTFNNNWVTSLCDYTSCHVGIPSGDVMTPIAQADADNGAFGFLKINITVGANYGTGKVAFYVYEQGNFSRGDTVSWELIWILAGDINGNGTLDVGEIAGDLNNNGIIDGSEIAGDFNGDGQIGNEEIAGDINGDGKIKDDEKSGDVNGDTIINGTEVQGDADGNGVLDNGEVNAIFEYASTNIQLYPNPASDYISISGDQVKNVSVYNMLGEVVLTNVNLANNSNVDVSNLNDGVYIVKLETLSGEISSHKITVK